MRLPLGHHPFSVQLFQRICLITGCSFWLSACQQSAPHIHTSSAKVLQPTPAVAPAPSPLAERSRVDVSLGKKMYYPTPLPQQPNREDYQKITENNVHATVVDAVSTLSFDSDTGSYSNIRRFLNGGQLPPVDAVRVEELINYFPTTQFTEPLPTKNNNNAPPFRIATEVSQSPWNKQNYLLRVGVKAVDVSVPQAPPANLIFLVDVSGSMSAQNKLPLAQSSLKLLTQQLRAQDRISLITYAGSTRVVLASTRGDEKEKILNAIDGLTAGGSTAGEAAMNLAYAEAERGFIKKGINRIFMLTDGDFNVGLSGADALEKLVEAKRKTGISLSTLGFGVGNYQEQAMERMADIGNGNYAYIDHLAEAQKVLVDELSSTFNTVAKDVKLQMEFNPNTIAAWRLIGYENRLLKEEDFKNDKVDAGEIGAGKAVTVLYELTPVGAAPTKPRRYDTPKTQPSVAQNEFGFLKLRYKQPNGTQSIELNQPLQNVMPVPIEQASNDLKLSASVAAFGQLLRQNPFVTDYSYAKAKELAQSTLATDENTRSLGYKTELITLIDLAHALTLSKSTSERNQKQ